MSSSVCPDPTAKNPRQTKVVYRENLDFFDADRLHLNYAGATTLANCVVNRIIRLPRQFRE
jgi:hypothetical protein